MLHCWRRSRCTFCSQDRQLWPKHCFSGTSNVRLERKPSGWSARLPLYPASGSRLPLGFPVWPRFSASIPSLESTHSIFMTLIFRILPLVKFTKPFISSLVHVYIVFLSNKRRWELTRKEAGIFILINITILKWVMSKYDKVNNQY